MPRGAPSYTLFVTAWQLMLAIYTRLMRLAKYKILFRYRYGFIFTPACEHRKGEKRQFPKRR